MANPAIIIAVAESYALFLGTQKQHWGVLNNGDWGAVYPFPGKTQGLGGLPLLPLPVSMGLETSGLDLLPSRLCPKPGRQTMSCVKVACDLGFPCKLGGQQSGSHCVSLTVMLHPQGIGTHA